jgi:hypothetical protein
VSFGESRDDQMDVWSDCEERKKPVRRLGMKVVTLIWRLI